MKILITGGNGFIGKSLYNTLHLENDIVIVDRQIDLKCDNTTKIVTDLSVDCGLLEDEIKKCDLVIHLASPVGIFNIDKNSNTFLDQMLKINLNVFNLVKKYNKKIIYSSTSEVYLNTENAKESDNLTIGAPDKLRWGYASGKLTSEFLCKSLCKNSIILRFFNATGIGDNKGVLYRFIQSIKNDKNIDIFGNGKQKRTFCDIRDVTNFISILIDKNTYDGNIYNVGNSNNVISINDLAKLCLVKTKSKVNINYIKYNDVFSKNYDDINIRIPNCDKMNKLMTSQYSIDDIIESIL